VGVDLWANEPDVRHHAIARPRAVRRRELMIRRSPEVGTNIVDRAIARKHMPRATVRGKIGELKNDSRVGRSIAMTHVPSDLPRFERRCCVLGSAGSADYRIAVVGERPDLAASCYQQFGRTLNEASIESRNSRASGPSSNRNARDSPFQTLSTSASLRLNSCSS